MRAVVQRVAGASVSCGGETRSIGRGLVVLVGIYETDTEHDRAWMAEKVVNLRIFEDDAGKMNLSAIDVGGAVLLVPNFTVAGDARKGRRPSFDAAMRPERSGPEFERLCEDVRARGVAVERGFFGGEMMVEIRNDGPITIVLDSR
ncbi:MAG: D-tyrosyl-tRNA(Tyr) deacylase [Phycisphaeraceae bacterium]|nr:D-tyrosyl-tRNA(Tyr) deacylase [Phycisphaeraceae bacterium]